MNLFTRCPNLLMVVLLSQVAGLYGYIGNRDLPSFTPTKFVDNQDYGFKSSLVLTKTFPISEYHYGDRVINPYPSYNLADMQESLNRFALANGQPERNFFAGKPNLSIIQNNRNNIPVDMIVSRSTQGVSTEFSYRLKGILDQADFPGDFGRRYNRSLGGIDLVFQTNIAALNSISIASYREGQEFLDSITGNYNRIVFEDSVGVSKAAFIKEALAAIRQMNDALGFQTDYCRQAGLSDLQLSLGICKNMRYQFLCRRISLSFLLRSSLPTGQRKNLNNALSFDFGLPYATLYPELRLDLEPKHGVFCGLNFNFQPTVYDVRERRIPLGFEPEMLSPLKGQLGVRFGHNLMCNAYLKLEKIANKMDLQLDLTYLEHGEDRLYDVRSNPKVHSFLSHNANPYNISQRRQFSAWHCVYTSLTGSYVFNHTPQLKEHPLVAYLTFDNPFGYSNLIPTKRLSAGVKWVF